jgi:NAD(P)-dependent dehydrogenase (short-subunit alcohol dehydrogenase family)
MTRKPGANGGWADADRRVMSEQVAGNARSLEGRTVLITGAARGIGEATARRLAGDGARLVLADVDGPGVEKLAAELGQLAVAADVTRRADTERMVDEPYRRWGRLDVLFNNAGVIKVQPLLELEPLSAAVGGLQA